jgi:uncharacterized protein YjiS (DUF1127 family)
MPKKPKPKPKSRLKKALEERAKIARTILGYHRKRRERAELDNLITRSVEEFEARKVQKRTGKDIHGVQRGRRTKKYPKGQGI